MTMPTKTKTKRKPAKLKPFRDGLNLPMFEKIMAAILKHPKQFQMQWITSSPPWATPRCGTAACIAGWCETIDHTGRKLKPSLITEFGALTRARFCLGLTSAEAEALFYTRGWPEPFKSTFIENGTLRSARVAVARIKHFIRTGK